MADILVLGGAGYIGSHVVNLLKDRDMIILDNLSTGRKTSVLAGEFVLGDFQDESLIDALFTKNKFKTVIHFAGSVIVPESVRDPVKYYRNNSLNTLFLIEKCLQHKVANFIFSGTCAVYGYAQSELIDENHPTNPISPYSRSKLFVEWALQDISRVVSSFNYISLRYFNVAGASIDGRLGQSSSNATHLIKKGLIAALNKKEKLPLYGTDYNTFDGTCIRDYIHVDDLAQAHLNALMFLEKEKRSEILNCGYGKGFSVREVVKMIKTVTKKNFTVEETARRAGDADRLVANNQKIKSLLGWRPLHADLKKIIESAYQWEKKLQNNSNY
ncbi:MAG: UDP-glucose 4-epimerase GalE [Halobacteriovoraceae bacterium]|nr:UDP-glucose 4-epimerase GalE [Halobacteriovoraceae bacterium]